MEYKIIGTTVPAVEMQLKNGEAIFSQRGGMAWQSEGLEMKTNTKGGLMKGLGRMLAGESLFMNTYTAMRDNVTVAFSSTVPGAITPMDLTGKAGIYAQKRAFLCAQDGIDVKMAFAKKLSSGLFGGEGFILQDISGNGTVFLEVDGDEVVRELAAGEVIKVNTGNVVAFEKTIAYEVETIKGLGNIIFGGEGLFLTKLTGPGKVVLQTQNFDDFASIIISMMPSQK